MSLVHRLAAVLVCIGVIAGNGVVCAGWSATPEARMTCCTGGGACPMHERDSRQPGSHHALTQAEADSCCASSEREDPGPTIPAFTAVASLADLGPGVAVPAIVSPLLLTDGWRTWSPPPSRAVPRHLLLSVLLV